MNPKKILIIAVCLIAIGFFCWFVVYRMSSPRPIEYNDFPIDPDLPQVVVELKSNATMPGEITVD